MAAKKTKTGFSHCPSFPVRSARLRRGYIAASHHYDFLKTPTVVTQASSHARSDPQRLVGSGEVAVYRVDRNHRLAVLNFLAESIRLLTGSARGTGRAVNPCYDNSN